VGQVSKGNFINNQINTAGTKPFFIRLLLSLLDCCGLRGQAALRTKPATPYGDQSTLKKVAAGLTLEFFYERILMRLETGQYHVRWSV